MIEDNNDILKEIEWSEFIRLIIYELEVNINTKIDLY